MTDVLRPRLPAPAPAPDLARARDGDDAAFDRLVKPLRGDLHAHCYRMLGSVHDADDAVQEALLRAWRGMARFEGRSGVRTWLHAIATRTCLDAIERRGRRALPMDLGPASERAVVGDAPRTDAAWLTPYPDHGPRSGSGPDDPRTPHGRYEQREAVELAFVAALQHLPGNQRAALLLFDVLGFSAREIATTMGTSTGSVTSALQRARATLAERAGEPDGQPALRRTGDARVRELVTGFATALEQGDAAALVALLTEDVTWSMPPMPHWYRGRRAVRDFVVEVPTARCGSWRTLATSANGQPALACYLATGPAGPHLPWSITVLSLRDEHIGEVTSFVDAPLFARFGLPAQLP